MVGWRKLAATRGGAAASESEHWFYRVALMKAVILTVWKGVALAAFTALFGVAFAQLSEVAFSIGWAWLLIAPLIDFATASAAMVLLTRRLKLQPWLSALSVFSVSTLFSMAGYLAFYSLAAAVYVELGSRDVSADIPVIDWYRGFIAPMSAVLTGYFDDVFVGLVTTGIGGLIAGLFRGGSGKAG